MAAPNTLLQSWKKREDQLDTTLICFLAETTYSTASLVVYGNILCNLRNTNVFAAFGRAELP